MSALSCCLVWIDKFVSFCFLVSLK
jgi:hypothetical protein